MAADAPTGSLQGLQDTDEATRLMCIGALVDRRFTEAAIREFLTQPLRAVPPSPGVDPRAVLHECLAARRRRRLRDLALAVLMAVFVLTGAGLWVPWTVVAVVWRRFGARHRRLDRGRRAIDRLSGLAVVVLVVAAVLSLVQLAWVFTTVVPTLFGQSSGPEFAGGANYDSDDQRWLRDVTGLISRVMLVTSSLSSLAMFAVLWVDRRAVWSAVTTRLRRGTFSGAPPELRSGMDAVLWSPGKGEHARRLAALPVEHVNCVVYRGDRPFVGSGAIVEPWSVAIPLEPADQDALIFPPLGEEPDGADGPSRQLSITGLHEEVTRQVRTLRRDSSLSPSHRLARLKAEGRVFAPARLLGRHADHPMAADVLGSWRRPLHQVDGPFLQHVARNPFEWMRYYAVYVVESWDREVTVSVFVHYGLDDRNLYIECVPCVLPPVTEEYRAADSISGTSSTGAALDALGSWTVLPLTVLPRFFAAIRSIKDPYRDSQDPERLGVAASLREIAASTGPLDYLQQSDVTRYLQLMQTRIIRGIGMHLESCGLSAVDFMRRTSTVTVNNTGSGDVTLVNRADRSVFGGSGHTVNHGNAPGRTYASGKGRSGTGAHTAG